jgi:5-methylcytosine-specific restriction endonuclease McrA
MFNRIEYRKTHKKQQLEYSKKYRRTHRNERIKSSREWREKNKKITYENLKNWTIKHPNYFKCWKKEWRHKTGRSKKYQNGLSKTREYTIAINHRRRMLFKKGGDLSVQTVQMIYEDNIKKYGTLTCYLCLQPILFGKDNLEHKIPLIRGGTNERKNLDIACQRCNNKKYNRTEIEYRQILKKGGMRYDIRKGIAGKIHRSAEN